MKIATENGLQLAMGRPKENLYRCLMNFRKNSMNSSKKCMMKMHEAEKHKVNQLQKNIISENNDIRDNIPFSPTTIGSDVSKPYQQDMKLSNNDTKSLSLMKN